MSTLIVLEGSAFCAGTAMGAASILSVGPNNIMLMREGLVRGRVGVVAATVWTSYLVLLICALVLADKIAAKGSLIRPILAWLGLLALIWFAFLSDRAYFRSSTSLYEKKANPEKTADCMRRALTVVWLNPLTYVELLFIPSAMGCNFIMPICRVLFIAGLIVMATISCFGYSFAGRLCAPLFKNKYKVRVFDLVSGIIFSFMACMMALVLFLRPS